MQTTLTNVEEMLRISVFIHFKHLLVAECLKDTSRNADVLFYFNF